MTGKKHHRKKGSGFAGVKLGTKGKDYMKVNDQIESKALGRSVPNSPKRGY